MRIKATFANPKLALWPGQFVNVRLMVDTIKNVRRRAEPAVQRGPNGAFVYVLGPRQRRDDAPRDDGPTGRDDRRRDFRDSSPATVVVTSGFSRLSDGAKVRVMERAAKRANADEKRPGAPKTSAARPATARRCARDANEVIEQNNERFGALHHTGRWRRRCSAFAVLLAGVMGYLRLSVSPLPQVDFPTIQVTTQLAGRQSGHNRLAGDRVARTAIRPNSLADDHVVAKLVRIVADHAAIRSRPRHRRGRAGRAIGDQRGGLDAAAQPALSAGLREGQSGGHADRDADVALANRDARAS